jgi:hypothetical protein
MINDERSKYVKPTELAGASVIIVFCLNYVTEWLTKDPLVPYGSMGTISVFNSITAAVVFAGTWLLFALGIPRLIALIRKKMLPELPFFRLRDVLIYILMGPIYIFGALLFSISLVTLESWTTLRDRLLLSIVLLFAWAVMIFWLYFVITKVVRNAYKTGHFSGVILPSLLILIMTVAINYYTTVTRLTKQLVCRRALGIAKALHIVRPGIRLLE